MKIYVTSLPGERLDSMAFHLAKRMFFDACGYDVFTDLSVPCCCGRPDWIEVFTEASKKNDAKKGGCNGVCLPARAHFHALCSCARSDRHPPPPFASDIGVFFCGPPSMEKDLATNIETVNSNGKSKTRFNLMAEKF